MPHLGLSLADGGVFGVGPPEFVPVRNGKSPTKAIQELRLSARNHSYMTDFASLAPQNADFHDADNPNVGFSAATPRSGAIGSELQMATVQQKTLNAPAMDINDLDDFLEGDKQDDPQKSWMDTELVEKWILAGIDLNARYMAGHWPVLGWPDLSCHCKSGRVEGRGEIRRDQTYRHSHIDFNAHQK
ncbi:hypothetical protein B0H17DRAFT_1137250 [Mycena rosella]|uniref:Uncharacterized protein n=1 Tax=Mycena rosella TaxID=1033263 RepID=A0AAD7D8S0_MYCRO|nr:hypothetical protein B0H17DRAFT_1137250 [Mycena rosella]